MAVDICKVLKRDLKAAKANRDNLKKRAEFLTKEVDEADQATADSEVLITALENEISTQGCP